MVEYASSKGVEAVSFNTNGILLTPEVADCFMNHSKGVMTFSVDGLEDSYKKIRKSNYGKVTKNIEFFLQRRNEKELFKPNISVNLVKCGQSDEEIREYINHWVAKVDYVTITERLDENLKIATKDEFISKELEKGRRVCLWPWRYMAVYWDGRIALCCHDLAGKTVLKTSLKEKSLAEIWNGDEFKSIRKQHRAMKFPADHLCASCEAWISPYLPSQLSKTEDGTTVWRKGLSTYYTQKPESLGLQS